ncbi:MAG: cellulase family glycosylhydrolase, partial [Candidatus Limnocylindria bacterium]
MLATRQQPMPDRDHSPTFWSQVASAFSGNDTVIFEVFNEPWPDNGLDSTAAWKCWRDGGTCPGVPFQAAGMQTLVNAIRSTGATSIIALGGVRWSNMLSGWLLYEPTDPLNNLVAAWHVYEATQCDNVSCYDDKVAPVLAQVPVLASEIGSHICESKFLNATLDWLDVRQSGYVAWTWNTWGARCASVALVSDYSGTPTAYGEIYRAHLAGAP